LQPGCTALENLALAGDGAPSKTARGATALAPGAAAGQRWSNESPRATQAWPVGMCEALQDAFQAYRAVAAYGVDPESVFECA
jgi:hypothetical protein